ncbi:MAG: FHA domain-containing protein [Ilumatobacteraceae bacterium]
MKLEHAGAGVSRTHAEVRVEDWQATLIDLGSSNGTEVGMPGELLQRLPPGNPIVLAAGVRVDLGGEVSFVVEPVD